MTVRDERKKLDCRKNQYCHWNAIYEALGDQMNFQM